jgi:hypothetical protein
VLLVVQGIAVVCAARRDPDVGRHRAVVPRKDTPSRPAAHEPWRRRLGMALSLIATPPPAATTPGARQPALTPHHVYSHIAVMGALPSSLSRRVDSLSSPNRLTATTGTAWRGTHTIRSRGVPGVPIQRRRERCLGGMGSPRALETSWKLSPPSPTKEDSTCWRVPAYISTLTTLWAATPFSRLHPCQDTQGDQGSVSAGHWGAPPADASSHACQPPRGETRWIWGQL